MSDEIFFNGLRYVSSAEAAEALGITRDYVARLCKRKEIAGKRVGGIWYVNNDSLRAFAIAQEYARAKRRTDLAQQRREEYKADTVGAALQRVPRIVPQLQSALSFAIHTPTAQSAQSAARAISSVPLHTVSIGKQVSAHALPPVADLLHKLLAIATALLFTVGTYLFVDAQYARLTSQISIAERGAMVASAVADAMRTQLAVAAENPIGSSSSMLENLARGVNRRVDAFVYGIMFPPSLTGSGERVFVRVVPQSTSGSAGAAVRPQTSSVAPKTSVVQHVMTQPVIERVVETQRIVASAGGLSEEILTQRLNALDQKFSSQIYAVASVGSANSTTIVEHYNAVGGALRIDELDKIALKDSTITGGSISGTSVSATSLAVTGSGTSTFSGGIQVTALSITGTAATSTFASGINLADGCFSIDGVCVTGSSGSGTPGGSDTQVQFNNSGSFAGSSSFTFSSSTSLLKVTSASSSLLSLFDRLYVGGTATTTIRGDGIASTLPFASSTALSVSGVGYFGTASTTNLTISGIQSSLLSTNATGGAQAATIGNGLTFSSNVLATSFGTTTSNTWTALQSFGSGLLSQASSTIGSGAQAGGLTISGGATTTGNLVVQGTGTSTFAGGLAIESTGFVYEPSNNRIGIGTAAPTTGLDVNVATDISGDTTISGGASLTISASGPINQSGTGQVTFAGNVDATNGLDVTTANFTVGGSNFTVAPGTGNTTIAGVLTQTGAVYASSTLQAGGATRLYSTLQVDNTLTAAGSGTGLSVTNNASVGGTLAVTGAATLSSSLSVGTTLSAATTTLTGQLNLSSKKITGVTTPSDATDAANKSYVDSVAQGLSLKDSVRAGTTANITLSGEQSIDGVALVAGDRVLVKNQSDATKNGIYVVSTGSWTRSTDADVSAEVTSGLFTFVSEGTTLANSGWVLTTANPITLDTTSLSFTQFSGAGQITAGSGITKSGNTLDVIGTANRITANADSIDIASTYVGQTSITTVGTLTSGSLGSGFGNIDIGASTITGGAATFSSITGSAITGSGNLTVSGTGSFTGNVSVTGTLTAATTTLSGNLAMGNKKITGLADPTSAQEAATKAYVDAIAQGLTVKQSVRLATTSNITLSGTQTIDGVSAAVGDRILVMGQTTASQNGIYDVASGAWSRSSDANENSEVVSGMYAFVTAGTAYTNTGWSLITANPITLDTTSLTFTQFSGSAETTAGDGLTKSGNTINAVGTADRISVSADAVDIASTYVGQTSITTVGTLTSGSIGSGFGAVNVGTNAITGGTGTFTSLKDYGTLTVGGTATTTIQGNNATSTFSGGITLSAGSFNLPTGSALTLNDATLLNSTTLGSSVVSSSLTSVGALDSGSITTGFGAINIGSDTLDAGTTTIKNLVVQNTSTSTIAGALTVDSTGLVYQRASGNVGLGTAGPWTKLTVSGGLAATASSTIGNGAQAGGLTISGGATTTGSTYFGGLGTFSSGLLSQASSTFTGFTQLANASTTLFTNTGNTYLTSLTSALLGTDNTGKVVATSTIGANLLSGTIANSQLANSSVTVNSAGLLSGGGSVSLGGSLTLNASTSPTVGYVFATSSLASTLPYASTTALSVSGKSWFDGGFLALASSTIGSGAQAGGLTISGGATTTGYLVVQGTGTSTFAGGIQSTALNITSTSATSTGANGWNLTAGCFAVNGTCVGGSASLTGTQGQVAYFSGTNTAVGTSSLFIATTGNVGVGTTTPFRLLSLTSAVSTAQQAIAYDTTNNTDILTSSTGDYFVYPSGKDAYFNDANLFVCASGSGATSGCPTGSPSGQGNLIVETKVGIASSTPWGALSIGSDGAIVTTEKALTDGATIAIDWTQGNQQRVVLGGNRAITFSSYLPAQILRLILCQDATGSRTITSWPSAILWQDGTTPTLTTTANKCDIVSFVTTVATGTVKIFGAATLNF